MPNPLSPQLERAYELLSDGEWHDREVILREIAKVITPGIAVRHAEVVRRTSGKGVAPAERKKPRSQEFLIASGKRSLARSALRGSRIEHRTTEDGRVEIRDGSANPQPPTDDQPVSFRKISAHLRRAFEMLADGRWRPREDVLAEMVKHVDRDIAIAVAERRRADSNARRSVNEPERRRRRNSEEFLIASGSRSIAMAALLHAKRIERKEVGGVHMVRLRPTQYGARSTT